MGANDKQGEHQQTSKEHGGVSDGSGGKSEQFSLINGGESQASLARLCRAALAISWISILFSLASGIVAIDISFDNSSESLFAYGLGALLDSLSSVVVVWRFYDLTDHSKALTREYKACIVIGFLFLVSAASLMVRSILAINTRTKLATHASLSSDLSLACGLISLAIALVKVYLGYRIGSRALCTDSIITMVAAASCFMALASVQLYLQNRELWFLDSVFGMVCSIFLVIFGVKLLHQTLRNKPKA